MDKDEIINAIIDALDGGRRRGRRWFFPKNVNNKYNVVLNMTLKELLIYVLPSLIISTGIAFIPPYSSIVFWLIKGFVIALLIVIPIVYVNYRPVKHRDNIRTNDFIKETVNYSKKQKVYYLKPKEMYKVVNNNE